MAVRLTSFTKQLFTDTGNIPLVLANICGVLLVAGFGARKVLYHPDVAVSYSERASHEFQNETPERIENARKFRGFNSLLSDKILAPIGSPMMAGLYGDKNSKFWKLETNALPVPTPLEQSSYFDDGLYKKTEPTPSPTGVMPAKSSDDL